MRFLIILGISFFVSVIFVYLSKKIANRFHLYDKPDSILAIHKHPVPLLGGLGILLGVLITFTLSIFFISIQVDFFKLFGVLIGGILAFFLGLWDDLKWKDFKENFSPNKKIVLQVIVSGGISLILVFGGLNIKIIPIGTVIVFLMVFYILGGMNAVNLQDGLDGLVAGLIALSSSGFAVLSLLTDNTVGLILSLSCLGAVLGFLVYNFHPASIFMGDSGSYFLGFVVVVLAIIFTSRPYDIRWFLGPILIIGLPVADTAWAVARRIFNRKNIFQGDRGHIYDRILQKGISETDTVLICYLIQIIFVTGGVSLTQL